MGSGTGDQDERSGVRRYKDIGWRSGNLVFPEDQGPLHASWLTPLDAVTRAVAGNPRFAFYDPADFMIMGRVLRSPRPSLVVYKHYFTRRELHLDDTGHAYRYIAPRDFQTSTRHGQYRRHRDLRAALDHLRLWHLPWMKPGLEHERRGLDCDDAWQLDPRAADDVA